jgi:RNA polymerase sigma-70 factor (sigma-E family)
MRSADEQAFREYATARMPALLRTAYLLCDDWHHSEDIVSTAIVKLYGSWQRAAKAEHLDAYVRRIVVRVWLDERRRPWRREHPTDVLPEPATDDVLGTATARRADLRRLLAQLPDRQRAVLVLRFYDDLSVLQTAEALGCSEGAVKTLTSRALTAVRGLLPAGVTTLTELEDAP